MNSYNTHIYRCASDIFNTTIFRKIVRENDAETFNARANRYLACCPNSNVKHISDLISQAYLTLSDNYRIEYFYKNTILNAILTQERFVQDSVVVFNEFKINKSIADVVFINGTNRVYEIKTELDSPERLSGQISDYKKMFSEISIVTHWSLFDKYEKVINDYRIGIYVLDQNLDIVEKREATPDNSKLDIEVMLKVLRKKEIESLIDELAGIRLNVSNMSFLDECLHQLSNYDLSTIQRLVFKSLKMRGIKSKKLLLDKRTMTELKYICLALNFSQAEYENFYNFIGTPINTPH